LETTFLADRRGETDKTDFSWNNYFDNNGSVKDNFKPDHLFDRADLMLQAVIVGMGLGLGRTLLIEGDIKAGYFRTVGTSVRMRSGYWLVCSASFAETDRFKRLRNWLKKEVEKTVQKSTL
jgi:LysR family glycine cleavage system transcriptional activator